MFTANDLKNDLVKLGFKPEDTVLIHSSCRSIGEVEGRGDTVLDVFMGYFGEKGLLVMPTLSWSSVNDKQPVFDVRNTPSCNGILAELFRKRPGVVRSMHPTHSVAAFGQDAADFTSGNEKFDTPCAKGSPWWKLMERGAKIFFIGTDGVECNTFCHGVDEWVGMPGIITEEHQPLKIIDYEGKTLDCPSRRHCMGRNQEFATYEPRFEKCGALTRGKFGNAKCWIVDARKAAAELGVDVPPLKR